MPSTRSQDNADAAQLCGLDALVGLVPGIGDALMTGASPWIVARAWSLGARWRTLARMLVNVVADGLLGAIPLLGDVVDVFSRANTRNLELLRDELEHAL